MSKQAYNILIFNRYILIACIPITTLCVWVVACVSSSIQSTSRVAGQYDVTKPNATPSVTPSDNTAYLSTLKSSSMLCSTGTELYNDLLHSYSYSDILLAVVGAQINQGKNC